MDDRRSRLDLVATELAARAPALKLEYLASGQVAGTWFGTLRDELEGLAVTTSLIPGGLAQVVATEIHQFGGMLPRYDLAIFEGAVMDRAHPFAAPVLFEHYADPVALAEKVVDWATGPLRTGGTPKHNAQDLEKRARHRLDAALRDAQSPPSLAGGMDLPGANPVLLAFHFPRNERGRLLGKARVLLDTVDPPEQQRRARCRFLKVQDGRFELVEASEFVENQDYRWDGQPWRWRADGTPPVERWGIEDLELAQAVVLLLEAAEWEVALRECGVQLGDDLRRILAAEPLGYLLRDLAGGWATTAAEQLLRLAPWRLPHRAGKKSIRLFGLGGVNVQRKPGVYLKLVEGRPTLDMEASASNRRLAREEWERPLDFEAYRLGVRPPKGFPIDWPELET
jgi:hypothetical protein